MAAVTLQTSMLAVSCCLQSLFFHAAKAEGRASLPGLLWHQLVNGQR